MQKIIIPALAGSAKTRKLAKAIRLGSYQDIILKSNKILYVAPSINLGDEFKNVVDENYIQEFISLVKGFDPSVSIEIINGQTSNQSVHTQIHESLTKTYTGKHLIIITHRAYERIMPSDANGWVVVMDECPSIYTSTTLNFSSSAHVADYNDIFDFDEYTRILTLNKKTARAADLSGINSTISDLVFTLKTGKYIAYARTLPEEQTKNTNALNVFVLPSKDFAIGEQFILLGAECNMHPIANGYDYLVDLGTGNVNHMSDKINIYFATDKTNSSRYLREYKPELYTEILSTLLDHARTTKNEHNILIASNVENVPYKPVADDIEYLEWNCIGQNKWQDSNTIILAASQNIAKDDVSFLVKYCGIAEEQLEWERKYQPSYQRIMRTCIRKMEALTEDVSIYVFSREEAARMKKYFPNANMVKIGDIADAKRTPVATKERVLNNAERKALSRFRIKFTSGKLNLTKSQNMKVQIALDKKGAEAYDALVKIGLIV